MSAHVLWIWVLGIHPHVKGTSTRKLLVWALSAIATNTHPSGADFLSFAAAYGAHSPADAPARKRAMTFFPLFSARRKPGTWSA